MSDAIRSIAALAELWGLEEAGLRAFIAAYNIATVKIGRQRCVRVSDLLAALDAPATPRMVQPVEPVSPLDAIAARIRRSA
jgi:hypothetical protein